jgi:hypothetical protein
MLLAIALAVTRDDAGPDRRMLILAHERPAAASVHPVLERAPVVHSLEELQRTVSTDTYIVAIDRDIANELQPGSMREIIAGGAALLGIEVGLAQLWVLGGGYDDLRAVDPALAEDQRRQLTHEDGVWGHYYRCSPEGARGGGGMLDPRIPADVALMDGVLRLYLSGQRRCEASPDEQRR